MDIFKQARRSAKAAITRQNNWIQDNISLPDEHQLRVRREVLQAAYDKYTESQDEIDNLLCEDSAVVDSEDCNSVEDISPVQIPSPEKDLRMSTKRSSIKACFTGNIITLKIISLYPLESHSWLFKPYTWFCLIVFMVPIPVLSIYNIWIADPVERIKKMQNIFLVMELTAQIFKFLPFKMHPEGVKKSLEMWDSDIFNSYSKEDEKIVTNAMRNYKILFNVTLYGSLLSFSFYILSVTFSPIRVMPIDIWLPFDALNNTLIYTALCIFVYVSVYQGCAANAAGDTLLMGITYQSAIQIILLKRRFMCLNENVDNEIRRHCDESMDKISKQNLRDVLVYQYIVKNTAIYNEINGYVKEIEKLYSLTFFSQLLVRKGD
ncbi:unnamed protein product [Diabrotica balteata]|uniref:Odorant receptor n=1 Tax=Diabrotica balteata TaxID=107213 RepID=A0A9N9X6Z5_DIABA|nr:unnamed protein product [Diabrotica balteata]